MPVSQYVTVLVTKTAMSKTPKTCMGHEVPILEERFGPENINIVAIIDKGRTVSLDSERSRLQRIYGRNEEGTPLFDVVYPRGTSAFEQAVNRRYTEEDIAWNLVPRKAVKLPDEKGDTGEQVDLNPPTEKKAIAPASEEPVEVATEKKAALAKLKEWGVVVAAQTGKEKVLALLGDTARSRLESAGFAKEDMEEYNFDTLVSLADSVDEEAA